MASIMLSLSEYDNRYVRFSFTSFVSVITDDGAGYRRWNWYIHPLFQIILFTFLQLFLMSVSVLQFLISNPSRRGSVFCSLAVWDILAYTAALSFFLLRFLTLGTKITKKFRNVSILITEQVSNRLHQPATSCTDSKAPPIPHLLHLIRKIIFENTSLW